MNILDLDSEYRELIARRRSIDALVIELSKGVGGLSEPVRIAALTKEFDETGVRADVVEEYAMTIRPSSQLDVIVLLRLAKAIASDVNNERYQSSTRNQLLPRMIEEAAAFLTSQLDSVERDRARGLSMGDPCMAWGNLAPHTDIIDLPEAGDLHPLAAVNFPMSTDSDDSVFAGTGQPQCKSAASHKKICA